MTRQSLHGIVSVLLFAIFVPASFAGTETTLHGFSSEPNGATPYGNLIADSAGNLYGAAGGGAFGVIFKLTPGKNGTWTETVIHNFLGAPDGASPGGNMVFDTRGNLYGTTYIGGTYGQGTVFKLTPSGKSWKLTILHSFSFNDGSGPIAVIFDKAGNLYGATGQGGVGVCYNYRNVNVGCGLVFELAPQSNGTWIDTTLHTFGLNGSDANDLDPDGQLVFDKAGNLYGTTYGSGCNGEGYCSAGEIFELSPAAGGGWTESILYSFQGSNASYPQTLVFDNAGNLYGTTQYGGTGYGGIAFEFSPPAVSGGSWTETVLHNFTQDSSDGSYPTSLVFDGTGNLYGTTEYGGVSGLVCTYSFYGCGTVFELSPSNGGWTESVLYAIPNVNDEGLPVGLYRAASGNLYVPQQGSWYGCVAGTAGICGSVLELSFSKGVWTPTVLHDFMSVVDGSQPNPGLLADGLGNYYGTTSNGGAYSRGTVFKLSPNSKGGWISTILYSFGVSSTDAESPMAGLIFDASGNLYGTSENGGANDGGTIFELSPGSQGSWTEAVLYSFPGYYSGTTNGVDPTTSLVFDSKGNLYGTTYGGGGSDVSGTVFELSPTSSGWSESVLHAFGSASLDGVFPSGPVILDKNGNLYGVTHQGYGSGGQYYDGAVYELSPPTKSGGAWTETILLTFPLSGGKTGASPSGSLVFDDAGNLYGTTEQGGNYNSGIVYKLSPSGSTWTETVLYSFKGVDNDGGWPSAGVILDSIGALYGTTEYGGTFSDSCTSGCGTVFKLTESSGGAWQENILYRFAGGLDGMEPSAPVVLDSSGNVYGTTPFAGSGAIGTVFEIKP